MKPLNQIFNRCVISTLSAKKWGEYVKEYAPTGAVEAALVTMHLHKENKLDELSRSWLEFINDYSILQLLIHV